MPVKNYLSKKDLVSSNELSKHGVKGYSFQVQLDSETVEYIENI